jgi:hypothetical protein
VRGIIKSSICLRILLCEKDFKHLNTQSISNTKFNTDNQNLTITEENKPLTKVIYRASTCKQHLSRVYTNDNYRKIEASIVSQLELNLGLEIIDAETIPKHKITTTQINTAFLKLPYQVSLKDVEIVHEFNSINFQFTPKDLKTTAIKKWTSNSTLYKNDGNVNATFSQKKDVYSKKINYFGGFLEKKSDENPNKYIFEITDLQAVTDTIYKKYSWNSKDQLKISYSEI